LGDFDRKGFEVDKRSKSTGCRRVSRFPRVLAI